MDSLQDELFSPKDQYIALSDKLTIHFKMLHCSFLDIDCLILKFKPKQPYKVLMSCPILTNVLPIWV